MEIVFIIVLLLIVVFLIYFAVVGNQARNKEMALHPDRVYPNSEELVNTASFVSGHPNVDDSFINTYIFKSESNLILAWADSVSSPFIKYAQIPIASIKNISIEDASTFEKRVSLGRLVLVGIFALAWKKNKKEERAFIIISWSDGQFEHETIFSFDKTKFYNPIKEANISRNKLLKICKS